MGQSQTVAVPTGDINDLGDTQILYEPGPQRGRLRGATPQTRPTAPCKHLRE